ncbi:dihydropteroate synthase [soil metagenome]
MKNYLNVRGKLLDCSTPIVMGILNITPDSFYDGGNIENENDLVNYTGKLIREGVSIIDIGAQSTRPGAELISGKTEWDRLHKPLALLRKTFPEVIFSVDTFHSDVAANAVAEGADIINDISGGTMDGKMFETIGRLKIPYVLMHIQGTPQTMQKNPVYIDVVKEVMDFFADRLFRLNAAGVTDIIIDPGFGFGKTIDHNFKLLNNLDLFKIFDRPILAGLSRKSIVNKVIGTKPENALNGTTVLNTIALLKGANILRVHDVKEAIEAIILTNQISKIESRNPKVKHEKNL